MVVKPSQETPLHAFLLAQMIEDIGLPAGVFNLVSGPGSKVGEALAKHPDVDMVSFTGSTGAGVRVSQAAAPSVKRVCLELGGKSALLIAEDADLEAAVRYGVQDVMINSGQTCTALTRMLLPASRYAQALEIALEETLSLEDGRSAGSAELPWADVLRRATSHRARLHQDRPGRGRSLVVRRRRGAGLASVATTSARRCSPTLTTACASPRKKSSARCCA